MAPLYGEHLLCPFLDELASHQRAKICWGTFCRLYLWSSSFNHHPWLMATGGGSTIDQLLNVCCAVQLLLKQVQRPHHCWRDACGSPSSLTRETPKKYWISSTLLDAIPGREGTPLSWNRISEVMRQQQLCVTFPNENLVYLCVQMHTC